MSKDLGATAQQTGPIADAPDPEAPIYKTVERVLAEHGVTVDKAVSDHIALAVTIATWIAFEGTDFERDVLERAVDRMGWDEIHAFQYESQRGQSIYEDAGGYLKRCIRRLFGLPTPDVVVESYKDAAMRMIAEHYSTPKAGAASAVSSNVGSS